jgi:hypothetical protein
MRCLLVLLALGGCSITQNTIEGSWSISDNGANGSCILGEEIDVAVPALDGPRVADSFECIRGGFSIDVDTGLHDFRLEITAHQDHSISSSAGATYDLTGVTGDRNLGLVYFSRSF